MNALTLPDLDIVRAWHMPVRATDGTAEDGRLATMEIRFSTFGVWYEINSWWEGHFLERTRMGAFARTIGAHNTRKVRSAGVKVLFNHGFDFFIGDKLLGPIDSLSEEPDSPVGIVGVDDTTFNRDLLPALRRGDYGSSFMFRVVQDEWNHEPGESDHNPAGLPERTITEVKLFEFGPVTWPANPDATTGVRSATDAYYESMRSRDPRRVDELRSRLSALRTPDHLSAPGREATVDGPGLATAPPTDPAPSRHSGGMTPAQRREVLHPFLRTHNGSGDSAGSTR